MLGVKISRSGSLITQDQKHFTKSLLNLYSLSQCKTVSTPFLPNVHFSPATKEEITNFNILGISYCSSIGSIYYLSTATRPDLAHGVSSLLQVLDNPGVQDWNGSLIVLRYLRGMQNIGLVYLKREVQGIEAYSDADWENCQLARCSVTGYLVTFDGSLVLWKAQKKLTVSLSTVEEEYKELCDLTLELVWLGQWCRE
ncbi:hypothetical protein O181_068153 [Austropuccinia psidii MF-1]|uniref:Mitochondrial protein n=1 Tax=Austropuccinia psidii MF-1 TaxID=1389203 RepID=A0A9Q3EUR2_9BASI|nr:hypothetical protein [Austropuccinia psidii MF-1]